MTDDLSAGDRYVVIRKPVRDAIWDVLADLFSLGISIVLLALGVQLIAASLAGGFSAFSLAGAAVGVVLLGHAAFELHRTFYR